MGDSKRGHVIVTVDLQTITCGVRSREREKERKKDGKRGRSRADFSYKYSYLTRRFFTTRKRSKNISCNPVLFLGEREGVVVEYFIFN